MPNDEIDIGGADNLDVNRTEDHTERELDTNARNSKVMVASWFAGPIPPPEVLAQYDKYVPGLSEKLINNFLEESNHRREMERDAAKNDIILSRRGQIFALIAVVICVIVGGLVAWHGQPLAGGTIATGTIVAVVTVFITGHAFLGKPKEQKKISSDEEEKS